MKNLMKGGAVLVLAMAACRGDDRSSVTRRGDLGTGINTVDRKYGKGAEDVRAAAVSALKAQDLRIESDRHDNLGGEIVARRAAGDKVTVQIRSLDAKTSDVSVRVDPGNRNMADMIHEKIADKLGLKEAKSAFFGGNSVEGTYSSGIDACVNAAEGACRKLDLIVTNRQVDGVSAVVDAREQNSSPVQFRMKKVDDGTQVTFIAGREKSDANKSMAERMKAEFDRHLGLQGN